MRILHSPLLHAVAFVGLTAVSSVCAAPAEQPGAQVIRGAVSAGPFHAASVDVDLRTLPAPQQWRPGDPIKVVPKQYKGRPKVGHAADYKALGPDPLAQVQQDWTAGGGLGGTRTLSDPIVNVAGPGFNGVFPPDTTGEVGKDYYVHMINGGTTVTILNKADGTLVTQFDLQNLAVPGSDCAAGLGDPIVLYDEQAERWLFSEFSADDTNKMCVYISKTADPITGGWWIYEIQAADFPDYPKYGVWPDAYYIGSNESTSRIYALDRNAMLSGGPTSFQVFNVSDLPGFGFQVLQPADQDGIAPPPAGTPGYFLRHRDDEWHGGSVDASQDFVELWEFHVDFAVPANSFVVGPVNIGGFADFDSELCDAAIFACFTQPSGPPLDPLREVVMFRVGYRNFGTHESMVGNFVVDLDGTNHGGIRWFELRRPDALSPWSLYQEGTYTQPLPDVDHRFMGSIAQDQQGNIALAYNVTSSVTFPSMRYTGRLESDTPGVMTQPEKSIVAGDASNLLNRWGDYAAMSVDPVDGCTFWHTNMYGTGTSWGTQIASFRFDECGLNPTFTLNATNLNQAVCSPGNLDPIVVEVGSVSGFADPVTLAYANLPAGFNGTFTQNPVLPPDSSDANVSVSAAAGDYTFDITGTATGQDPRMRTAQVSVASAAPGSATLNSPANGSSSEPSTPTLVWNAATDAASYLVEIDNDPGFGSPEYTVRTNVTSHTVIDPLAPDTYHWRVTAENGCGGGAASATFVFTVSASLCTSGPLIDNGTASFPFTVGGIGTITDLDVTIDISHTYIGDLDISLSNGTGNVLLINSLQGGACNGNDILATLDDEAVQPIETACSPTGTPAVSGTFTPTVGNPLSTFDGQPLAGTWTVTIVDNVDADSGTLNELCLVPQVQIPDTDGDGVTDDVDNCVAVANAGQEDGDGDSVGDVCDNCTQVANPSQCDADNDLYGNRCDGDFNQDLFTNQSDLGAFRSEFRTASPNSAADHNCDGFVNQADLGIFRQLFRNPPGPSAFN